MNIFYGSIKRFYISGEYQSSLRRAELKCRVKISVVPQHSRPHKYPGKYLFLFKNELIVGMTRFKRQPLQQKETSISNPMMDSISLSCPRLRLHTNFIHYQNLCFQNFKFNLNRPITSNLLLVGPQFNFYQNSLIKIRTKQQISLHVSMINLITILNFFLTPSLSSRRVQQLYPLCNSNYAVESVDISFQSPTYKERPIHKTYFRY